MNPSDTVEYNSLNWVKKELDLVLDDAQKAFNAYIDDTSDADKLQECIDQIHLIHGTLLMVELYGAAMLAEEIEQLALALLRKEITGNDEIFQLIMGAMLRLPDYLDGLVSGNKDIPIVLLPVLNDLRAARNESLLSENLLFFPDIDSSEVEEIEVTSDNNLDLQQLAKRLRPHFQLGLLTWFKDEKPLSGLKRIQAVINELEKSSTNKTVRRLWNVSSALLEALIHKGIDSSITIKLLIGKIDRLNKELIDKGENALASTLPTDIIKNLLYYIARSDSLGDRVASIKDAYRLNELLPANNAENEAALNMGGPNIDLLQTVSQAIREDFTEVKDALELFVHGESRDKSKLEPLPTLLGKIADTMGMLSLGAPRQLIMDQKTQVARFISGDLEATDQEIMDVASVLLNAEAQLNNFIARRSSKVSTGLNEEEANDSEYQDVLASVAREALQDFSQAKQSILLFADNPQDVSQLEQVLDLFARAGGAMFMAPLDILAPLIRGIASYVDTVLLKARVIDPKQMDVVADAVTSIEYYLEAVIEGRKDLKADLNFGRSAVEKLRQYAENIDASVVPESVKAAASAGELTTEEPEISSEINIEDISVEDNESDSLSLSDTDELAEQELEIAPLPEKANVAPAKTVAAAKPSNRPELAIISDDIDEEIFEIFIEEALEVLGEINENLPAWRADNRDEEARAVVRRSFHTLKGSGRLIGAMMIGEFAWCIENMLNRVIDQSIDLNNEVFNVLDESVAVLPQLIEQLQGNSQPVHNLYQLMDHADALSKGEQYCPPADTESDDLAGSGDQEVVGEPVGIDDISSTIDESDFLLDSTEEDTEALAPEPELSLTDSSDMLDDLESDDTIDFAESISLEDLQDEDREIDLLADGDLTAEDAEISISLEEAGFGLDEISEDDLSFENDSDFLVDNADFELSEEDDDFETMFEEDDSDQLLIEPSLGAEDEELTFEGASLDEIPVKVEIDSELFNIFKAESEGHLQTVREMLILNQVDGTAITPNDKLIRALHTLYGSARTAEVAAIAGICGAAEQYVKIKQENHAAKIEAEGVAALTDMVASVAESLHNLETGKPLTINQTLVTQFEKLYQQELQQAQPESVPSAPVPDNALVSYGDIDDELVDIFLEEAEELVEGAEKSLASWKENLSDVESVNELKRILHTLKGGARMAELTPIGDLTHALETTIIDAADSEPEPLMPYMQEALDTIVSMLAKVTARAPLESAAALIDTMNRARKGDLRGAAPVEPIQEIESFEFGEEPADDEIVLEELALEVEAEADTDFSETMETEFAEPDLDLDTADEIAIDISSDEDETSLEVSSDELDDSDTEIEQQTETEGLPAVVEPERPVGRMVMSGGVKVFQLDPAAMAKPDQDTRPKVVQEQIRVRAELLNDLVNNAGEVNIYNSRFNQQLSAFNYNIGEFDQTVDRLREQLRNLEIETETQILSRHEKESSQYDAHFDPLEMDRYSTMQQLSRSLMESISDLESIKDFMGNTIRESETLLQQQSRISTELQESLMRTRMIRFSGLSTRLGRIVRQTARELNKTIEFNIKGDELEVDRSILDRIVSPLEHLLRNAVSHGIESDEDRKALNKTALAEVRIDITKDGQDLVIKVSDNGAGINVAAIRNKAIKQGMMAAESDLTDHEIVQFILEPGFSTAEKVTQISGRGVGLDVVDSEIKQLGGSLDIRSKLNQGTSFIARLPMTLSINQALLVHIQEDIFAVPLTTVEGVVRLSGYELQMAYEKGDGYYEFSGDHYDIKYLGYLLKGRKPDYLEQSMPYPVLLVKTGDIRVAVHVDSLVGRREIVVKPVGAQISTVKGISGATILGDGHVVLILDMAALLRSKSHFQIEAQAEEMQREAAKAASDTLTVMVVDDSITIRKVTERILNRRGMEVILAKDGLDASAKLQERLPDIMLLDIEMPRMDGYEVATMVRNNEHMKHLPIIMITSRTGAKHKDKAMEIGVNRYLGKPYQEDELIENITEVLKEVRAS